MVLTHFRVLKKVHAGCMLAGCRKGAAVEKRRLECVGPRARRLLSYIGVSARGWAAYVGCVAPQEVAYVGFMAAKGVPGKAKTVILKTVA